MLLYEGSFFLARTVRHINFLNYCNCAQISYLEPAGSFNLSMRMGIVVCVYAICIVLGYDVYLSDLQVLEIWDLLDLQPDLGKPSRAKPRQASSVGSPQSVPRHVTKGNVKKSTLGKRQGRTHLQQCQRCLSRPSIYKSMITSQ